MSARLQQRAGLTLIELLVALVITGMALSGGYGALSWMTETRRRVEETTSATWHAAAVRRTIDAWLAGATLAVTPDVAEFRGIDGARRGADDDAITFRTNASTPLGTAETVVTLQIDRDDATPERGLVALLSQPHGPAQARIELEPRAAALDARYLSGVSGSARWTTSWISSSVLPRGIELTLRAERGDSLPALLALPFVVSFASGGGM
jgi:prepilin-type N-terminal cleavage/methylation domain-containing protein